MRPPTPPTGRSRRRQLVARTFSGRLGTVHARGDSRCCRPLFFGEVGWVEREDAEPTLTLVSAHISRSDFLPRIGADLTGSTSVCLLWSARFCATVPLSSGDLSMATFLMFGKYSPKSLKEAGPERTKEALDVIKQFKGQVEAMYATLGPNDLVVVANFPGTHEAMQASIALTN